MRNMGWFKSMEPAVLNGYLIIHGSFLELKSSRYHRELSKTACVFPSFAGGLLEWIQSQKRGSYCDSLGILKPRLLSRILIGKIGVFFLQNTGLKRTTLPSSVNVVQAG
ncbi:hypothetical protein Pan153_48770 [Gimesia panareensis]|uniref:Uncharacterized protein n=1 Tax=Gimesia panareensis TaxID=2527978 RepID=A0A518FV44_9PLAN|nr:hypothetical protein Pan153_48770 [Gimesia panareensis]